MQKILVYVAFGFLTFAGTLHFVIDVLSQFLRGKRVPGPETTLYYGFNTAYALGQVLFGVLALLVARRAIEIFGTWSVMALCLVAALAWLACSLLFIEYWQPKLNAAIFAALVVAVLVTR